MALAALSFSFTRGMKHFDDGGVNTPFETLIDILTKILFFPGSFIYRIFPFHHIAADWMFSILNSILWGYLFYIFIRFLFRRLPRQPSNTAEQGAAVNP